MGEVQGNVETGKRNGGQLQIQRELGKVLLCKVKWVSNRHFLSDLIKDLNFFTIFRCHYWWFFYTKLDERGPLGTLTLDELHMCGLFSSFLGNMVAKARRIQDNYNLWKCSDHSIPFPKRIFFIISQCFCWLSFIFALNYLINAKLELDPQVAVI